jgi:NAD+ kinase
LVIKNSQTDALGLAEEIAAWLKLRGVPNITTENREDLKDSLTANGSTLVLVLGGDGTMISVARKICGENIILLGINFARVGFLTECSQASWRSDLEAVLSQGVEASSRMLLDVRVVRRGETLLSTVAVNDIVVGRGNLARLVHLKLFIEDERIAQLRADGLILSTPTGSSAYAYSAGGPLIHPDLDVIGITPICSFLTKINPFVLPADKRVVVDVAEDTLDAYLTLDGQTGLYLQPGDRILATGSSRRMFLAAVRPESYFQKLKAKGFIQGG